MAAMERAGSPRGQRRGRPRRDEYVSPTEAAAILSAALPAPVSSRTVSRWFDAGTLTGYRTPRGRRRRIRIASIEKYLKAALDTSDLSCRVAEMDARKEEADSSN